MISDLGSYSVDRFIPFTAESYFRLFARQNEVFGPLQFVLAALGAVAAVLAVRGKGRAVALLLAIAFAVVAVTFHFRLYAELTPVGTIFGWVFLAQAGLLLVWAMVHRVEVKPARGMVSVFGLALVLGGIIFYPLLARLTQHGWASAEIFGAAPDPTVAAALGVMLIIAQPRWLLVLFPLPLLWCAVSSATLHAIEAPFAWTLPSLALLALVGAVLKCRGVAGNMVGPH